MPRRPPVPPPTVLPALTALVLAATPAVACGTCVMAAFDQWLPPITGWVLLCLSWFGLSAIAVAGWRESSSPQPGLGCSLGLALLAVLAGAAILGPLPFFALALAPFGLFLRSLWPDRRPVATPPAAVGTPPSAPATPAGGDVATPAAAPRPRPCRRASRAGG